MAQALEKPNTYPRISAPAVLDEKTVAFLRRRAPERCVVFAAWDALEPAEGKYDEDAYEELRGRLMTVGSSPSGCSVTRMMHVPEGGSSSVFRRQFCAWGVILSASKIKTTCMLFSVELTPQSRIISRISSTGMVERSFLIPGASGLPCSMTIWSGCWFARASWQFLHVQHGFFPVDVQSIAAAISRESVRFPVPFSPVIRYA